MNKVGDSQEQINKCLSCDKYICTNCVESKGCTPKKSIREDKFYELYDKGYTDIEIAEAFHVAYATAGEYRRRRNLKPNRPIRRSKDG